MQVYIYIYSSIFHYLSPSPYLSICQLIQALYWLIHHINLLDIYIILIAKAGFQDAVLLLLSHRNIDGSIKNNQKQTALDITKSKPIISLLKFAKKKHKLTQGMIYIRENITIYISNTQSIYLSLSIFLCWYFGYSMYLIRLLFCSNRKLWFLASR